jgi:two-component system, sensor histidine kinase
MAEPIFAELDTLFPLYLVLNDQDEVSYLSQALAAEIGDDAIGKHFQLAFSVTRPLLRAPLTALKNFSNQLFLFNIPGKTFAMRGALVDSLRRNQRQVMVVTPWLTWMQEHQAQRAVSANSFPILDAQMELQLYLSSQQLMMSDLHSLLAQLKIASSDALAASAAKSEFMNHVSHELRTPLNGIVGATELLSQHSLDEASAQLVSVIRQSSAGLLTVINQVLDYSRLAAKDEPLQISTFEPVRLCQDVIDVLTIEAFRQQTRLLLKCSSEQAPAVSGDTMKIRNVLLRLTSNAIKHGGSGDVMITHQVSPPDHNGRAWLRIEVEDQGPGIPALHRARIFEPFQTLSSDNPESGPSPGLGLAMARTEVRLMGGEIGLEPAPSGQGCLFWFQVPVTAELAFNLAEPAGQSVAGDVICRQSRILLVDDNIINLQLAKIQLERLGVSVDTATSGKDALEKASQQQYTMILMDIQMPGMSGTDTSILLRKLPSYINVPIIAWTANSSTTELSRYQLAGINDTLAKPASMVMLKKLLDKWTIV